MSDAKTLYVQYNRCANDPAKPFADFARELFAFADAHPVDRVVVDLRYNGGGNSRVIAPLIDRRQALVDAREAAWGMVSGNVADTLGNMDAVRALGAERKEAHEHRDRVAEQRRLAIRSWDFANLRIDTVVAPLSVLTNTLGLLVAIKLAIIAGLGHAFSLRWLTGLQAGLLLGAGGEFGFVILGEITALADAVEQIGVFGTQQR